MDKINLSNLIFYVLRASINCQYMTAGIAVNHIFLK